MTKIRVLQIVTRLVRRGVPRHVLDIAAGLNPARYTVEVLAGRSEPGEAGLWEEADERGISTGYVAALQREIRPAADAVAFAAIYQRIRQGHYDVVHTHISKAGILGRLAAKCAGVPVILHTYHGRAEETGDGSFRSRVLLGCERLAASVTDAFVAVSEETARLWLESGVGTAPQYKVIYNGIAPTWFHNGEIGGGPPAELKGKTLLGTVGSLTPEKGLDALLEAMPQLARQYPELRLCILGDGPLGPFLRKQAQDLGLQDRICFVGNVADLRPWLTAFDLFLLPSRSEGLPYALLEAMAMGRPVVASRVGGIPEVVLDGRTGALVPPGDPRALAAAIGELLQDVPKRQAWGQAGRAHVQREFTPEKMICRLEQLYEELLATKRG